MKAFLKNEHDSGKKVLALALIFLNKFFSKTNYLFGKTGKHEISVGYDLDQIQKKC